MPLLFGRKFRLPKDVICLGRGNTMHYIQLFPALTLTVPCPNLSS